MILSSPLKSVAAEPIILRTSTGRSVEDARWMARPQSLTGSIMSDSPELESASLPQRPELSDDLPPVQPPSAGFIVQLFVVPGLIVLAVVAVWALFGRIAAGDQDWRKLTLELQSPNDHIRKRAMYGLAQVLDQDRRQGNKGSTCRRTPRFHWGWQVS